MKTRNLLLALGCIAMFTACNDNDEPSVAPAMRAVTLSVDVAEPADTRVSYTEDGTTYKFAWSEGDKLRVFYKNSENAETYADFTIDTSTINGKKAEFTGELPTSVTNVTISYQPNNRYVGDNNMALIEATDHGYTSLTEALKTMTYLYAENVEVTNAGTLPDVKLKHAVAYLILKKDLQVTDSDITLTAETTERGFIEFTGFYQYYQLSSTGISYGSEVNNARIIPDVYVEEGKLSHDLLVPFFLKEETEVTPLVQFGKGSSPNWTRGTSESQTAYTRTFKPGVIYEMKSLTDWIPSTFKE